MIDWFIWNGTKCTEKGIIVLEQPLLTVPAERTTSINVPGRPGSLIKTEGMDVYDDMILTAACYLRHPSAIPQISAWLKGSGTVTFATRPGGFYYARIANQISFAKILRGNPQRSFAVNFRCKPFWYVNETQTIVLTQSGQFIVNPGTVYAEPVITVYGNGDITLMVGTTVVELTDISGSIILDSVVQEAYTGNTLMNDHMTGDFPILMPGSNAVSWAGDVTRIVIAPNWRYL